MFRTALIKADFFNLAKKVNLALNFKEWLILRLKQELPGQASQMKMMPKGDQNRFPIPEKTKPSSILMVLFPDLSDLKLLAIKRAIDGSIHSGQIAFPGGKMELTDSSPEATALREADEEIHLQAENILILGRLSPLYIPVSGFKIWPIVAYSAERPKSILASSAEVAEIITISLKSHLTQKETKLITTTYREGSSIKAPGYKIDDEHFLWGASAMILSELEALWKEYNESFDKLISD